MYHISFRQATLNLYSYFGSMRKTALVLKVSVASISRWTRRIAHSFVWIRGVCDMRCPPAPLFCNSFKFCSRRSDDCAARAISRAGIVFAVRCALPWDTMSLLSCFVKHQGLSKKCITQGQPSIATLRIFTQSSPTFQMTNYTGVKSKIEPLTSRVRNTNPRRINS